MLKTLKFIQIEIKLITFKFSLITRKNKYYKKLQYHFVVLILLKHTVLVLVKGGGGCAGADADADAGWDDVEVMITTIPLAARSSTMSYIFKRPESSQVYF